MAGRTIIVVGPAAICREGVDEFGAVRSRKEAPLLKTLISIAERDETVVGALRGSVVECLKRTICLHVLKRI